MRIKKVDSKSIILHEETEVECKTVGDMREVQFFVGVNKKCPIQNISKDKYLDRETGEIKESEIFKQNCKANTDIFSNN